MATKLDLVRAFPDYYKAKPTPSIVAFGPLPYLSVSGRGEPEGEAYTAALGALYGVAYGVKKLCQAAAKDFVVSRLEGLWWVDAQETLPPLSVPRARWNWQLLVRLPDFVTEQHVREAKTALTERNDLHDGSSDNPAQRVSFGTLDEGRCVQLLHRGPYSDEPATLEQLEAFIEHESLERSGRHHEIYLSDPRRSKPEMMQTILRQPVR